MDMIADSRKSTIWVLANLMLHEFLKSISIELLIFDVVGLVLLYEFQNSLLVLVHIT